MLKVFLLTLSLVFSVCYSGASVPQIPTVLETQIEKKLINTNVNRLTDAQVKELLITGQTQYFLQPTYGDVQLKKGNTPNVCVFSCKEFGCNSTKKLDVIMIEGQFHDRCRPVPINSGFECPCFYLLPYASGVKGLDYMKKFTSYIRNVCSSQYVCNGESYTPAVAYLEQYYAVKNEVYVLGYNKEISGQQNKTEVKIPAESVPQQVQIVQTVVEQTTNDPTPKPSEKPDVVQCPNVVPYRYDIIKYLTADELKKRAIERCKHESNFVFFSCVYDSSIGVHRAREEYEEAQQILSSLGKGQKICASVGDPHNRPFYGNNFNVYNVQGNRLLYKKGTLSVNTNLAFSRLWGQNSIIDMVKVDFGTSSFSVKAPVNGVFQNPIYKGFTVMVKEINYMNFLHYRRFEFNAGVVTLMVEANYNGFLNVYVTVPDSESISCEGECCVNGPTAIKLTTGDPNTVVFKDPCTRKKEKVETCIKENPLFREQFECVKSYADRN